MVAKLLEKDHALLGELLQSLGAALRKQDVARGFELLDLFWARLAVHIRAENVYLFPAILNAPRDIFNLALPPIKEVESTIELLRADHKFFMDVLSNAVKTMRELLANSEVHKPQELATELNLIRAQVAAISVRLKAHNELEEGKVYGWPALMLSSSDLATLKHALQREIENLPPRFQVA